MTPRFSIITITFNAADVIVPTLKSVAEQDYCNYEHIIVDGASSDRTVDIAKTWGRVEGEARMQIISEPDNGLYDAMNKGIHRAKGDYLIFLNAGDSFHSVDTLSLIASAADSGDADIIYGDTILVDSERRFVAKRHLSVPERLSYKSFKRGMLVCHQAFIVRRELAPDYNLSYRFSADYDWCLHCLKRTSPEKCRRITDNEGVIIDYLTEGLTDKNHKVSLRERYAIMCHHYGSLSTFLHHISFIPRYILRKFR